MDSSSSTQKIRIIGAVLAGIALVLVGVVVLNNANSSTPMSLGRTEAIAKLENAHVPLANLPAETEVIVPDGWTVESDKPVEGAEEEELNDEEKVEQDVAEDEDIDSPLDVEEDEDGEKYVAQLDENVIVADETGKEANVVADATAQKCYGNLKKCGWHKTCNQKCKKNCRPYSTKVCKAKKFCKCFCKFYKNLPKARRCVIYKKTQCYPAVRYRCVRNCKKYCKRSPRCYCCPRHHIRRQCRRTCKKISYKTKCGKCRCYRLKCYKYCKFVCEKYGK